MNQLIVAIAIVLFIQPTIYTMESQTLLPHDLKTSACWQCNFKEQKNQDKFTAVLLKYEKEVNWTLLQHFFVGVTMAIGSAACLYGLYKYQSNSYAWDPSPIETVAFGSTMSLIAMLGGGIIMKEYAKGLYECRKLRKALKNDPKTDADCETITSMSRIFLRANIDKTNFDKGRYILKQAERYELYHLHTNEIFYWDMKDHKFVKRVFSGQFNSLQWKFRKRGQGESGWYKKYR